MDWIWKKNPGLDNKTVNMKGKIIIDVRNSCNRKQSDKEEQFEIAGIYRSEHRH